LGLIAPPVPWHSDRSPIWAVARVVEATALTMGKIATDIALLAQSSIAEVMVRAGGSSSMPGKRNPIDAVRARAAVAGCSGFAAILATGPPIELDRGVGGWHAEWLALPMLFHTAGAAVEAVGRLLSSLQVDTVRMTAAAGAEGVSDSPVVDVVLGRYDEVVG
jgi:3-carboxy-cis,cis-muconate cycloisomerase